VVGIGVKLCNVSIDYGQQSAVRNLSGEFARGALTAIVGANGAGKSSLLKAIVGLVPLQGGSIELGDLKRSDLAYLPQQSALDRSFPLCVGDVVALGDWRRSGWARAVLSPVRGRVEAALEAVGLPGFAGRTMEELSVGQFQRVLFARMWLQDAPVLLLDEPFAAVDEATTRALLAIMLAWGRQGRTVIAVLHDLRQVRDNFTHALMLAGEAVAWGPTPEVFTSANLELALGIPLGLPGLLRDESVVARSAA
jgi:zinc/manganese transport system ATP-binding protein